MVRISSLPKSCHTEKNFYFKYYNNVKSYEKITQEREKSAVNCTVKNLKIFFIISEL